MVSMYRTERERGEKEELRKIDKLKREFVKAAKKLTKKTTTMKENNNLNNVKDYESLLGTSEEDVNTEFYLRKNVRISQFFFFSN